MAVLAGTRLAELAGPACWALAFAMPLAIASGCSIAASSTQLALLCRDLEDNLGPADWLKDCIFWVVWDTRSAVCVVQATHAAVAQFDVCGGEVMCTCLLC